jgi:hypothetical protein
VAEETGLIVPLERWVLNAACAQVRRWQATFPGAGLASLTVNLSGRHLASPGMVADVAAALAQSGLAASCLVLELTESMLVHDTHTALERLRALKALGVRLAIDDFGTGYSSLAYLQRFPVDLLKIDKSFVDGIGCGSAAVDAAPGAAAGERRRGSRRSRRRCSAWGARSAWEWSRRGSSARRSTSGCAPSDASTARAITSRARSRPTPWRRCWSWERPAGKVTTLESCAPDSPIHDPSARSSRRAHPRVCSAL